MSLKLQSHFSGNENVKDILKKVDRPISNSRGEVINFSVYYLAYDESEPSLRKFYQLIKDDLLYKFVFSNKEIKEKSNSNSESWKNKLFNKALRKLSKHTAKGELGELIIFTLLEVYLDAPKILSKISTKTSPRMPVYGADAVHGQFVSDKFVIYLGESKLHKNYNGAVTKAVTSIESAKDGYQIEFDLLDSNMDFPNIDEKIKNNLIDILDPYSESETAPEIVSPCFIGFNNTDVFDCSKTEEELEDAICKEYIEKIDKFYDAVDKTSIEYSDVILLLMPFKCIDELVDGFVKFLGVSK